MPLHEEICFLCVLNRTLQSQKIARGLKFRIWEEVALYYYLCRENKCADQLRGYHVAICAFVFKYAKSRFSEDMA